MIDAKRSWTRIELIHDGADCLKSSNISDSLRNVEWMLCELLKSDRAQLYAYPQMTVSSDVVSAFRKMLSRRLQREPLQYVLGYTHFYGLRIELNPAVLIPRPETELLVDEALSLLSPKNALSILDIGTGSGCIALALKYMMPEASVYACDVSDEALFVAMENARLHNLDITFFRCDIHDGLPPDMSLPPFDLIVSNPPYIPRSERMNLDPEIMEYEPDLALFVEADPLLYYRSIAKVAKTNLRQFGRLLLETHTDFTTEVCNYLKKENFSSLQIIRDLSHNPRIVHAAIKTK